MRDHYFRTEITSEELTRVRGSRQITFVAQCLHTIVGEVFEDEGCAKSTGQFACIICGADVDPVQHRKAYWKFWIDFSIPYHDEDAHPYYRERILL